MTVKLTLTLLSLRAGGDGDLSVSAMTSRVSRMAAVDALVVNERSLALQARCDSLMKSMIELIKTAAESVPAVRTCWWRCGWPPVKHVSYKTPDDAKLDKYRYLLPRNWARLIDKQSKRPIVGLNILSSTLLSITCIAILKACAPPSADEWPVFL